jgi:hypothetical protein
MPIVLDKIITLLVVIFWVIPSAVFAVEINLLQDVPVRGDVVLSPAKVEKSIDAGTGDTVFLDVLNRTGQDQSINIEVEDFSPDDGGSGVTLGKPGAGHNSSLKKYLTIPKGEFILKQGEQAHVPVKIVVPKSMMPGGIYGVVLISGTPAQNTGGATKVITRMGSLFFVRVNGSVRSSGQLNSFDFKKEKSAFELIFRNDGDIYLNPYGVINVYERYSHKLVGKIVVDPWFVMPQSSRVRLISGGDWPAGEYTADIFLNRGYNDMVDERQTNFEIVTKRHRFSESVPVPLGILSAVVLGAMIFYVYRKN